MIKIAKICGLCNGSKLAIDKVWETYDVEQKKDSPRRIVVYKEILHNKRVISDFLKKGIICVDDISDLDEKTIVVIRAHGEGKKTYDFLESRNITYIDATCPNVLRIHDIVKDRYEKGYEICLIGKKLKEGGYHPEVEGTYGWCNNDGYVIDSSDDIDKMEVTKENILVICQTTANEEKTIMLENLIKEKYPKKNVEIVHAICHAQKRIQTSSIELAKEVDLMIVIGGKNSSNTNELYNKCAEYCQSIKISSIEELKEYLQKNTIDDLKIGLTGGASTPLYEIDEYKECIEKHKKEKLARAS